jgi:hypothetical protein
MVLVASRHLAVEMFDVGRILGEQFAVARPLPRLADLDDQVLVTLEGFLDLLA